MAYVPVPKDLTKVKTKVAFNLTKRQLVCFGEGRFWAYRCSFCSVALPGTVRQPCA